MCNLLHLARFPTCDWSELPCCVVLIYTYILVVSKSFELFNRLTDLLQICKKLVYYLYFILMIIDHTGTYDMYPNYNINLSKG